MGRKAHMQPCWTCENYVDGCSWSRKEHKPVEGWEAIKTVKHTSYSTMESYEIHYCPEYKNDGTDVYEYSPIVEEDDEITIESDFDGEKLKEILAVFGLAYRDVGERIGCSGDTIGKYARGTIIPSASRRRQIANAIGVSEEVFAMLTQRKVSEDEN